MLDEKLGPLKENDMESYEMTNSEREDGTASREL